MEQPLGCCQCSSREGTGASTAHPQAEQAGRSAPWGCGQSGSLQQGAGGQQPVSGRPVGCSALMRTHARGKGVTRLSAACVCFLTIHCRQPKRFPLRQRRVGEVRAWPKSQWGLLRGSVRGPAPLLSSPAIVRPSQMLTQHEGLTHVTAHSEHGQRVCSPPCRLAEELPILGAQDSRAAPAAAPASAPAGALDASALR